MAEFPDEICSYRRPPNPGIIELESARREGRGRRCWLGDMLECLLESWCSHLETRMI